MADKTEDTSSGIDSTFGRFKRLVGEGNLYAPQTFSQDEANTIAMLIGQTGLQLDLDCPGCKTMSTFQLPPVKTDGLKIFDPFNPPTLTGAINLAPKPISTVTHLKHVVRALELRCARHSGHRVEFIIRVTDNEVSPAIPGQRGVPISPQPARYSYTFEKIGQSPQHAELAAGRLKAISKIAAKIDVLELRRAVGLRGYDVSIGAFVYLRRVFERIIDRAWKSASDAGEVLPDPMSLRMGEKVKALSDHLPEIVVSNANVYGILSLGLHELTEEDCARAYPVVEESIIAMLEDAHAHVQKKKRDKLLAANIAKLSGELKKDS
jgi:hypothetical protein